MADDEMEIRHRFRDHRTHARHGEAADRQVVADDAARPDRGSFSHKCRSGHAGTDVDKGIDLDAVSNVHAVSNVCLFSHDALLSDARRMADVDMIPNGRVATNLHIVSRRNRGRL